MAEMVHVICKTTTGSQTLSHIAKSERLREWDRAATNHITADHALCGKMVEHGSERVLSDPMEELGLAAASRACQACLNILQEQRRDKVWGRKQWR